MKSALFVLMSSIALIACTPETYEETARYRNTYEIIGINPPKHFYLDLKNVKTGVVHKHVYVSKHCNDWRKLKIGSRWDLTEVDYKRGERYGTKILNMSSICDALRQM